jgi:hypothetical protein
MRADDPKLSEGIADERSARKKRNSVSFAITPDCVTRDSANGAICVHDAAPRTGYPDGSGLILYYGVDSSKRLSIIEYFSILHPRQANAVPYPQTSVARAQKRVNARAVQRLAIRSGPCEKSNTIEAHQPGFRPNP